MILFVMNCTKTLQLRIKDKHAKVLCAMAREVNFSQDSRGRWCFNVAWARFFFFARCAIPNAFSWLRYQRPSILSPVDVVAHSFRPKSMPMAAVPALGLLCTCTAIHAKIKNPRKDGPHPFSTQPVANNAAVFVGDVASAKLVKTQMAKSTLDAGWSMLKTMWEYKSHQAGVVFEVVNESHSTQTCSCCGAIPASGHKDRAGLGIREWVCSECGTGHDRDTNAAKNILAARHRRLADGITVSLRR